MNFLAAGQSDFPALGLPPTTQQVESIITKKEAVHKYLEDLLEHGDWSNHHALKRAAETVVRLSKDNSLWGRARRAAMKLKRQITASAQ